MPAVQNLESKNKTSEEITLADDNGKQAPSFVEGRLGVTAQVTFHLRSPWKAIGAWIRKVAA